MIKDINHITLSGEEFPIRLDNLVLQKVQEEYGNIEQFEFTMMGWTKDEEGRVRVASEPSIKALNFILPEIIFEGYACEGKECEYTAEDLIRLVDVNPLKLALLIHEEVSRCFERKKKENELRSQSQKRNLTQTEELTSTGFTFWELIKSAFQRNK